MNKKKLILSFAVGLVVSVAALYLALKNVPIKDLADYVLRINLFWTLPTLVLIMMSFVLRAVRWRLILDSSIRLSFFQAYHPLMIGFMINCVLPGRVGEVARPVIIKQKDGVPFSTGIATVAIERFFDAVFLVILFAVVVLVVEIDPDFKMKFGEYTLSRSTLMALAKAMFAGCIALITMITLFVVNSTRRVITLAVMLLPKLFFFASDRVKDQVNNRIAKPIAEMIEGFASGFDILRTPSKLALCVVYTIIVWFLAGASYYFMMQGCPGVNLSIVEMVAYMVIVCFFIALPSVPGFWGIWEAGGVFALTLFGIGASDAAGFTLVNHAIQILPVVIAGIVSAVVTGVNIMNVSYAEKNSA